MLRTSIVTICIKKKTNTKTLGFSQEVRTLKQTNCAEFSDSNLLAHLSKINNSKALS